MRLALVAVTALIAPVALSPAAVAAVSDVGDVGIFELDGNPDPDGGAPPVDWEDLFTANGSHTSVTLGTAGTLTQRTFVPDPVADDNSYFASNGGGVKDIAPIGTWGCKTQHTPTPKDNLFNAYAMMAQVTSGPRAGHLILYLGSERKQNEGSAFAGFWINQDELTCNLAAGEFDGSRTNGDLLVVADYESGGDVEQIAAYQWIGGNTTTTDASNLEILQVSTGVTNADCDNVTTAADLCATTNSGNVTTAWGPAGVREAGTFVEAGLDLTALYARRNQSVPCFSQLFAETRSSRELTATLKDFAEDSFDTCRAASVATNLFEELGATDRSLAPTGAGASSYTVTLPASVYDTAILSGTSGTVSGTVTYSLWRNSTCTTASTDPVFTNGTNSHTVTISGGAIPPSPTLVFDDPGTWYWKAAYSGADRNLPGESDCATEPLIVAERQPAIATTPSAASIVLGNGNSFSDTADISAGYFPSGGAAPGTVTFNLYGPFADVAAISCAGTAVHTSTVNATRVTDTTARAVSTSYTPTAVGIFQWVATYNGNVQNLSAGSVCSDATERVTVTPATPGIATKILLSDSVKITGVTGAGTVTGNATFRLYGPFASVAAIDCTGTPLSTQGPTAISAAGIASTTTPVAVVAGVYAWGVTFASTSANYNGTSSTCTAEVAAVSYTSPSPFS